MKKRRYFLSYIVISVLIFVDITHVFAQSTQSAVRSSPSLAAPFPIPPSPTVDPRVEGGSFGKGEGLGPIVGSPDPTLPGWQPTIGYGGLTYQVHILGEVNKPGTYRVTASTRLVEALQAAGGVLERGSERRIELRRMGGSGEGGRRVDLVSFRLFGDLNANPYLLDNDLIYVPLKEKIVMMEGAVKRSGTYELKNEKTLEDLLRLAGGLTPGAGNTAPVKIIRYDRGEKEIIEVQNSEEARREFQLRSGDAIIVPHIFTSGKKFDYNLARLPGDGRLFYPAFEERIFVLGAVASPGPQPYNPYYRVGQYVTAAGGMTKLAKSHKIRIVTSEGKKLKGSNEAEISPGDAIIVPEKYMAPESILSLVLGVTTSVLAITTTILTLGR